VTAVRRPHNDTIRQRPRPLVPGSVVPFSAPLSHRPPRRAEPRHHRT